MAEITPQMDAVIKETADKLEIKNPKWLENLIAFETGGTFSPDAKNPYSSARGLIQFIDKTALGMGYDSSMDLVLKNPTFEKQMRGPVTDYLKPYSPFNSEYELYMAVFFPLARRYPPTTKFKKMFQDTASSTVSAKARYESFSKANPGIKTPLDYVNLVKKKAGDKTGPGVLLPVALFGIAAFFFMRRKS